MTTELDIINYMLISTGEEPVSSEDSMHPSAVQAKAWFNKNNRSFQQRGWWFNTEYNLSLGMNEEGKIVLPDGTLKIKINSHPNYYIKRGQYLYDPVNHTYVIDGSVCADVTLSIDPDDLPPAASNYLTAKCVYDWYSHEGPGDKMALQAATLELTMAKAALTDTEVQEAKINAFQSPLASSIISRLPSAGWNTTPTKPRG